MSGPSHAFASRPATHEEAPTAGEAACYVAEMTGDLAMLARRAGLDTLAYLLEMARLEAENNVQCRNGYGAAKRE